MPVSKHDLDVVALSEKEYEMIVERLGREPNAVELGMFGSLWSEHCGYKHSKALLKMFPNTSPRVLIKPGEENAGAVDIGDGYAIVMKVESHNHPSAIEPYQGAATGVGGIVRDIFTMGARPIALLNSLRFGPLSEPRNRYLFGGVVGGISGYGNCLGIPDVGGEIYFSKCYSENPLVNAMCVGVLEGGRVVKARASGEGNLLMLVGADTGRDGIHGASGLASRTFEEDRELRPTVQVGNPFLEKCLIEACLEIAKTDYIVGMQDLGAAGLTSASVESAYRGRCGIVLDISRIPRREQGMTAYEVMLSESQERMLLVVKKGYEDKVKAIFDKWDLRSDIIGHVTGDGIVRVIDGDKPVATIPAVLLTEPPVYRLQGIRPSYMDKVQSVDLSALPEPKETLSEVLLKLLASPNIASKEPVFRQYDHQVLDNTVVAPGSGAAVLRIKGTKKGIALTNDCNGRYCYLDPYQGGVIAVAEAARNLVCVGAEPIALTDCLNFGNPEKLDIYYQLEESVKGLSAACKALGVPVISGNVSLYNESRGEAVYPTPVIGMLGLLEDIEKRCTSGFKAEGDVVFLLGPSDGQARHLAGSEFLEVVHGLVAGKPEIDLDLEKRVQAVCLEAVRLGLLSSAQDCSDGGLAVALAESAILGGLGFAGDWKLETRADRALFGEAQSRIVVSVAKEKVAKLRALARKQNVPMTKLGTVQGDRFAVKGLIDLPLAEVDKAWRNGLLTALGG